MVNIYNKAFNNIKDAVIVGITIKLKINLVDWGIDIGFEDEQSYIQFACFKLYVYPIYK